MNDQDRIVWDEMQKDAVPDELEQAQAEVQVLREQIAGLKSMLKNIQKRAEPPGHMAQQLDDIYDMAIEALIPREGAGDYETILMCPWCGAETGDFCGREEGVCIMRENLPAEHEDQGREDCPTIPEKQDRG